MTKYNIWNPATARRIIHSGVPGSSPIEIPARSTREGVELTDVIAEELMERNAQDPENELRLDFATESTGAAMKLTVNDDLIDVVPAKKGRR